MIGTAAAAPAHDAVEHGRAFRSAVERSAAVADAARGKRRPTIDIDRACHLCRVEPRSRELPIVAVDARPLRVAERSKLRAAQFPVDATAVRRSGQAATRIVARSGSGPPSVTGGTPRTGRSSRITATSWSTLPAFYRRHPGCIAKRMPRRTFRRR
jgi:hypothetical protein